MKFGKLTALFAFFFAGCLQAAAQEKAPPVNQPDYNKPKIFADLPERLVLHLADAELLLNLPVGATVNASIATGLNLAGTVVSKSSPADLTSQSIVIKSNARGGAIFTFSRIKTAGGNVLYRGRMLSRSAGDALEISKEGPDYIIRKKGYYDIVNE